jgi:four helix bundle protein
VGNFRDLEVYQRAVTLADKVHRDVSSWPSFERWTLGTQLVRAADSIGANLAEAGGRRSLGDERRFVLIARGSAFETEHWLERAVARHLPVRPALVDDAGRVARMLNALANALTED